MVLVTGVRLLSLMAGSAVEVFMEVIMEVSMVVEDDKKASESVNNKAFLHQQKGFFIIAVRFKLSNHSDYFNSITRLCPSDVPIFSVS